MLVKTATPRSIGKQTLSPDTPTLALTLNEPAERVISEVTDLPVKSVYRRPDLRQVEQQPEKLFTFETEIGKVKQIKEALNFPLPLDNLVVRKFNLTVELLRRRSSLRGIVRLRLLPSQLRIEFPEEHYEPRGRKKE